MPARVTSVNFPVRLGEGETCFLAPLRLQLDIPFSMALVARPTMLDVRLNTFFILLLPLQLDKEWLELAALPMDRCLLPTESAGDEFPYPEIPRILSRLCEKSDLNGSAKGSYTYGPRKPRVSQSIAEYSAGGGNGGEVAAGRMEVGPQSIRSAPSVGAGSMIIDLSRKSSEPQCAPVLDG